MPLPVSLRSRILIPGNISGWIGYSARMTTGQGESGEWTRAAYSILSRTLLLRIGGAVMLLGVWRINRPDGD